MLIISISIRIKKAFLLHGYQSLHLCIYYMVINHYICVKVAQPCFARISGLHSTGRDR